MTRTLLVSAALFFAAPAYAEPPAPDAETVERLLEMSERLKAMAERLEDSTEAQRGQLRGEARRLIEDPDALRDAAREMQRALEDSDMIETLAEMAITLSEQVEVVEGEDSMSLSLMGREMLRMDAEDEDRITLRAGGKRITIESD